MADYKSYTNQELARLLQSGDQLAYTEIYERYKKLLYLHAYKKLGDVTEAGDAVQDVFLSLWNKRTEIDETGNLSGYLYTILRNRILNIFAQKKVRDKYETSLFQFRAHGQLLTDHLIRERQMASRIALEIEALPEKMREIFLLSRQEHLKNKEIAAILGISEHTVATQLKRALKQLRIRLGLVLYITLLFKTSISTKPQKINKNNLQVLYPIALR